ncbi:hypothetical protein SAMN05421841_1847 [Chryseobacterium wanjuense]|uniref:YD repeat-containing protein n=1 Tax=Chryseobacterium wanjuense TaxID=356305 RepID=A0A1I0QET1_9FLAO|nr:hypothetical protein [Chryseobacterium wanjuense]SEW25336.1 hypothetical protein SAMN05421841_1847 [Chryseobacterium wanjuense]
MKKIIIAIGLIATQFCYAQTQDEDFLPKIVPSSPQASELGKYGNVPIGMFTGSPNINLNIYTLEEGGISVPVNATYNSNGVQVDGVSKQLGIDWNLIAGGVISRQVNDLDDLQFPFYNVNTNDLCNVNSPEATLISTGTADTEKDIFSFSFSGGAGKFFFDGNSIIQINPSNIKIEKLASPNNSTPKFKITDTDGTEYYYGGESAVESSFNRSYCGGVVPPVLNDTSWYLTKIKTVEGQEVSFSYLKENFQYKQSYYQTAIAGGTSFSLSNAVLQTPCYNELRHEVPFLQEVMINNKKLKFNYQKIDVNSTESKQLISVEVYNGLSLLKTYTFSYDSFVSPAVSTSLFNAYTNANEKHIFLKDIKEITPSNESITRYSFDYYSPDELAPRHSFAKDIYGYLNGANNQNIIYNNAVNTDPINNTDAVYHAFKNISSNRKPDFEYTRKGMLKNIYYPTKGRTEFIYEANSILRDKTITPPAQNLADVTISESVGYGYEAFSQVFTVTGSVTATLYAVAWRDCGEDDPVHPPQVTATIINADTGAIIKSLSTNETPANTAVNLVAGVNYKIKSKVLRPCLGANAFVQAPAGAPYAIKVNEPAGGVRVAKTLDYDNSGNIHTKKYYYGTLQNLEQSSGIPATMDPNYMRNVDHTIKDSQEKYVMYSNFKTSVFSLDGYSIMYPTVIESFGENFERGGIVNEFNAAQDGVPVPICEELIRGTAFTNSLVAGNPLKKNTIRKEGTGFITLRSEEYLYSRNPVFDKEIDNFVGKLYKRITDTDTSDGTQMPDQNSYSVNSYQTRSEFNYLSSKKIFEYDTNGLNPIKTELHYFYNNPLHFGITKEKNIQPDAVVNETSYSYAHEKSNQLMIDRNMIGIPLETTETQTNGSVTKTLEREETIYPTSLPTTQAGNLVLPLSKKSYDVLSNISSTDVTFDKYDDKGNIVQYTTKDGVPVTIIWGYNKTEPIVKVEGLTYAQVSALSSTSAIISASDSDASDPTKENLLLDALNGFRKESALAGKQVSTYTYDPLIGVTSITPPSGIRQIFVYDSFGTLKDGNVRMKNTSGTNIIKTVKKNKYQYKQ